MFKQRVVKRIIMNQMICDKCGKEMYCSQTFMTYPPQYAYTCEDCGGSELSYEKSGTIRYEFEEEENV